MEPGTVQVMDPGMCILIMAFLACIEESISEREGRPFE